jgi:hypothetical protein
MYGVDLTYGILPSHTHFVEISEIFTWKQYLLIYIFQDIRNLTKDSKSYKSKVITNDDWN